MVLIFMFLFFVSHYSIFQIRFSILHNVVPRFLTYMYKTNLALELIFCKLLINHGYNSLSCQSKI